MPGNRYGCLWMGVGLGEWAWFWNSCQQSAAGPELMRGHVGENAEGPCASQQRRTGTRPSGISGSQKRDRIYGGQTMPGVQHLVAKAPLGARRERPAGEQGQVGGRDGKGAWSAPVKHWVALLKEHSP